MKAGYKTTEFKLTLLSTIAGLTGEIAGFFPEKWGAIFAGTSQVAYIASRTILKYTGKG